MAGFTLAYRALQGDAGGCPIEAGLIGSLADHECPHGHLPTDPRVTCGCWRRRTPDLMGRLARITRAPRPVAVPVHVHARERAAA